MESPKAKARAFLLVPPKASTTSPSRPSVTDTTSAGESTMADWCSPMHTSFTVRMKGVCMHGLLLEESNLVPHGRMVVQPECG